MAKQRTRKGKAAKRRGRPRKKRGKQKPREYRDHRSPDAMPLTDDERELVRAALVYAAYSDWFERCAIGPENERDDAIIHAIFADVDEQLRRAARALTSRAHRAAILQRLGIPPDIAARPLSYCKLGGGSHIEQWQREQVGRAGQIPAAMNEKTDA